MPLIDLPQAKWGDGTGRQVILKGDFEKIEGAVIESFELDRAPALEYVDSARVRVGATADCPARVTLCGFPSPLHPGLWVRGGLTDGRYRENSTPAVLDFGTVGSLWGTEKASQWYCLYALAGSGDTSFSLKAMPVMRFASQSTQVITLRNTANSGNVGYGFSANELVDGKILVLSGVSRGLARLITANNADNLDAGTITYGGSSLTLSPGDWFIILPKTNFRYLGMVFNDGSSNLQPFHQQGRLVNYLTPREVVAGAINGFTYIDLALVVPPTARRLQGFAAATAGSEVRLAISYDGASLALVVHGAPPSQAFQGCQGAIPFSCRVLDGGGLYVNNDNTPNQSVKITAWEE